MSDIATSRFEQRVGHPPGLFVLFFAEMWERFSYYGMRALLVFYMTKGFLGYNDVRAYEVYGAYTALVYATPYIGGMVADKLLGARRTVVIGGALMAAGHLAMTIESTTAFFLALALLICGNGFFKPNISTIVGGLYPPDSPKRDGGFTLFYMGINLGAAMAPLLCGYVGETYGWHYGFGLATVGMLAGLAVFVAPSRVTQVLIGGGALVAAVGMVWTQLGNTLLLGVNLPVAAALVIAAGIAIWALSEGPLPAEAGAPPDPELLRKPLFAGLRPQTLVLVCTALAVPVFAFAVQYPSVANWGLNIFGIGAFGFILYEALRSQKVERERLFVVLVLMVFSMLFWAFFEQAGSSVNNFTDRNVDRVSEEVFVTEADVGKTLTVALSQEQLGYSYQGVPLNLTGLADLEKSSGGTVQWAVDASHVGMGLGGAEVPASVFQAVNPICILLFGLVFTGLWGFLAKINMDPPTPVKFGLGLVQLAAGFGVFWWGAETADARGMVAPWVLIVGYALHTTGELCLSPVGLSMVTRLSPARIVSTVMGGWFLATAFSNVLGAGIAKLTGVHGEAGEEASIPLPVDTVHVYGDVFGQIAVAALIAAVIVLAISPLLMRWMHEHEAPGGAAKPAH